MRWIRVVDVETTGMDADSEVIELGQCVVTQSEFAEIDGTFWSAAMFHDSALYTPSKPLSPEVRAIHGIEMRDLPADLPFKTFGHNAWSFRGTPGTESAIACHNAEFDSRFLAELAADVPFLCTYKCALRIWPDAPSHNNNALRYWLQDQELWPGAFIRGRAEPAHRAGPDAYVTAHLLETMLQTTPLETLLQWSAEPKKLVKMPFGKHRGTRFDALPMDYLQWATRSDLGDDIKASCRDEISRRAAAARAKATKGPIA